MIWSENWRELAKWYQEMFELETLNELDLPDDTGITFKVGNGDVMLWVGYHNQVTGNTKEPYRIMIGLEVEDVYKAYEELSAKGVTFIATPRLSPTENYHVATAQDPEGNIIQLFS